VHEEPGGLSVTTSSSTALDRYVEAVELHVASRTGADEALRAALDADPYLAMAWLLVAIRARLAGRLADGRAALERATAQVDRLTERERSLIEFYVAFIGSDRFAAERALVDHLRRHPRDRIAVAHAHTLYNMLLPTTDRRARHHALFRELAPQWGDDWYLVGALAFVESEAGNHALARTLAERSLDGRRDNASAAHAMAHALLETGAVAEGRPWLDAWLQEWGPGCVTACHLTWHHALLELADGDSPAAARRLDAILGYKGSSIAALTDGASLMWRLELEGWPDALPWSALEDVPTIPGFVFGELHRALVLAGLRRPAEVRSLALGLGGAAADACVALAELVEGEPGAAADRLLAREAELVAIGGSRAQLEVLDDTLVAALARDGRREAAAARLRTRLADRASERDERWLASISA
jgi:hypothetical protein